MKEKNKDPADNLETPSPIKIVVLNIYLPLPALTKVNFWNGIFQIKTLVVSLCLMDWQLQSSVKSQNGNKGKT